MFHGKLELRVENKVFACSFFPTSDVLNAETVSVKPRQENVSNYTFNAICGELEGFSAYDWTVTQIKSDCVRTKLVGHKHRVWVILLAL